jgi:hypothetical protein
MDDPGLGSRSRRRKRARSSGHASRDDLSDAPGVWWRSSIGNLPPWTINGDSKMLVSGRSSPDRRAFIGGSDARIIMGEDEAALLRLWHEKRGEVEPEDLANNLIVQLGTVTEHLNRHWYERHTGPGRHRGTAPGIPPCETLDGGDARRDG